MDDTPSYGPVTAPRRARLPRRTLILAASLVPFLAAAARAQAPTPGPCDNLPQTGMTYCYRALADSADVRLRALLVELRGRIRPYDIGATQSHWQRYRDGQCALEYAMVQGGSTGPMVEAVCRLRIAWDRIAELRPYLCEGGPTEAPCEASRRYGDDATEPE